MNGYGYGGMWTMGGMMIFGWLLTLLVIGLVVWLVVSHARPGPTRDDGSSVARRILAERYARGEIDADEYTRRLAALH